MTIPDFSPKGHLPSGIHLCSGIEFGNRFIENSTRQKYRKPIYDILDFAKDKKASHIFVGGSFITNKENPYDFDCLIVFEQDRDIPSKNERIEVSGIRFDILYASKANKVIVDSFLKLFSTGRYDKGNIGIIQIDLYGENNEWEITHYPSDDDFEIIKKVYNDRSLVDYNENVGTLVSIHGLLSRAEWNKDLAPIASSQGWTFAPYIYDPNKPDLLFNKSKRSKVVDDFRNWIYEIQKEFGGNISIIAHSFGTFIIAQYLKAFDAEEYPPVTFNSIILTGSILNTKFDWNLYKARNVGAVYNMIAPNDEFVKFMPQTDLKKYIGMSSDFGKSGVEGFSTECDILSQSVNNIFSHTNTFGKDIIEQKWMPFLNINKYSFDLLATNLLLKKHSK
ncbi:MAG: hypothetical protein KAI50_09380 [Desulfobacterales bacterium]|nr:hypothetical protein [Desulfobacterales bacterium]